jgi:cytochrome c oxidase subunit 6a
VIPALCIGGVNAWRLWDEHWEHKSHEPPVEERTEYPYMNIRTKNFFWGDGDKVRYMHFLLWLRDKRAGRIEL